jgi:tetratricopeptide (TPR) repeat protein
MMMLKKLFLLTLILTTACTSTTQTPLAVQKPTSEKPAETKISTPAPVLPKTNETITLVKPLKPVAAKPVNKPTSAAVESLMVAAEKYSQAGNLAAAESTLERALRINPRNPELTYQLAALRLKQQQPRSAEELAKKAVFLAASDSALKKRCWLLISEARKLLKDSQGATEAREKAASLE